MQSDAFKAQKENAPVGGATLNRYSQETAFNFLAS